MYTLFQLLYLAGLYLIYRGFESTSQSTEPARSGNKVLNIIHSWQLRHRYLLAGALVLAASYSVHQNAALFALGFLVYLVTAFSVVLLSQNRKGAWWSKYFVLSLLIVIAGAAAMLVPTVRAFLGYALTYQPKWAEVASAQNPWRIVDFFLAHNFVFSLTFLAGSWVALRDASKNRAGVYILVQLLIPVIMFSFVFQYRKNDYVFHVYPLYLMICSVGLSTFMRQVENFLDEHVVHRLPRKLRLFQDKALLAFVLCLLWFPLTGDFRFAQKIPRLPDGCFNGAIYHNEWKAAAEYLVHRLSREDKVMSTLPLSVCYYLGRAHYNLNISNSDLARVNDNRDQEGRLIDFYSGARVIDTLEQLLAMISVHPQGWLVVDTYRFNNPVYVPETINRYIEGNWEHVFESQRNTITVYRWQKPQNISTN